MRVVIIGAGGAGMSVLQTIREADKDLSITLIARERVAPYSPVSLPYLVSGALPFTAAHLRRVSPDYFKQNRVETVLGSSVCRISPNLHSIAFTNGKTIYYDKLIIASGAIPVKPPIGGLDLAGVFYLDILRSTRLIKEYLRKHRVKQAVVIGAGFTGIEAALALKELGVEVTIIELLDRALARILDPDMSAEVHYLVEQSGIKLQLGQAVNEIIGLPAGRHGEKRVKGIKLSSGERLECEMVIVAIGVKPNVEFLQGSGIKVNRGIVVDDYLSACGHAQAGLRVTCSDPALAGESISENGESRSDIYAAGDVAEVKDFLTGQPTTSAIWPNAVEQGRVAALNILTLKTLNNTEDTESVGKPTPQVRFAHCKYEGAVSINVLNINGVPITGMGLTENEARQKLGEPLEILYQANEAFKGKVILKNNQLVGFQGIGPWRNLGFIWSCLKKRLDVSPFKNSLTSPKGFWSLKSQMTPL